MLSFPTTKPKIILNFNELFIKKYSRGNRQRKPIKSPGVPVNSDDTAVLDILCHDYIRSKKFKLSMMTKKIYLSLKVVSLKNKRGLENLNYLNLMFLFTFIIFVSEMSIYLPKYQI